MTLEIFCNPGIKSKYENSVFPFYVHSTVNLPALRPKVTNVTLMSFSRLFPVYSLLSKLTKSVRSYQHLFFVTRNHENWNLSFRNFLLKYEPRIKDKELHDKEQKIYTTFFYFYVLKELSLKNFSYIFSKRKFLRKKIMQKIMQKR